MIGYANEVRELPLGESRGLAVRPDFHVAHPTEFVDISQYTCVTNQSVSREALVLPATARAALRAARDGREMKQPELADKLGVDDATLGHYETGERPVPEVRLRRWARLVGMSEEQANLLRQLSLEARIGQLLADGGMPEKNRERVIWMIQRSWSDVGAVDLSAARPKGRAASSR